MTMLAGSRVACTLVLILGFAASASAQAPAGAVVTFAESVEWTEMVPGVSFGPVYGDWTVGPHGKLVRFVPGFASDVHTHTHEYHGVVISGTITNPYPGEETPPRMGPGTYFFVPAGAPHTTTCVSEEPCLFYTHGDHLWDIQPYPGQ
jgi:quercetin dioxygenase-like cupin family protein